jgi:predicted RNA binding protein YcfA (HicA-like mRNA interferase family)
LCNKKDCKTLGAKGGHAKIQSPTGKITTIPIHGKLKVGTLEGILKRLEIPEDVFIKEWEE